MRPQVSVCKTFSPEHALAIILPLATLVQESMEESLAVERFNITASRYTLVAGLTIVCLDFFLTLEYEVS